MEDDSIFIMPDEMPVDVMAIFHKQNKVEPTFFYFDDVEYKVRVLESTQAGTLKKRGSGIRYKIEVVSDDCVKESFLFRIGDTWYLAKNDDRIPAIHTRHLGFNYSGNKMIDGRYNNPHKVAVDVCVKFYADGTVEPLSFWWNEIAEYKIDKILEQERAASLKAGIIGLRYKIRVKGKETYLFRDDDLWFMESKEEYRVLDVHGRFLEKESCICVDDIQYLQKKKLLK